MLPTQDHILKTTGWSPSHYPVSLAAGSDMGTGTWYGLGCYRELRVGRFFLQNKRVNKWRNSLSCVWHCGRCGAWGCCHLHVTSLPVLKVKMNKKPTIFSCLLMQSDENTVVEPKVTWQRYPLRFTHVCFWLNQHMRKAFGYHSIISLYRHTLFYCASLYCLFFLQIERLW